MWYETSESEVDLEEQVLLGEGDFKIEDSYISGFEQEQFNAQEGVYDTESDDFALELEQLDDILGEPATLARNSMRIESNMQDLTEVGDEIGELSEMSSLFDPADIVVLGEEDLDFVADDATELTAVLESDVSGTLLEGGMAEMASVDASAGMAELMGEVALAELPVLEMEMGI